jgi:outer membrane protein assembly factor BamD (BamD/ComL family)
VSAHNTRERYALELKVLQPARAALARGDFSAALASIAEHRRRFPDGQLSEEREALRVQALSGLGRNEEATRAAAAFRKNFPGSVLISRMQALRPTP